MEMKQVSDNCFAALNEKNRVCNANSGHIDLAGGVLINTPSNMSHARKMIDLFSKVWPNMPKRVINTHEDADHLWGDQLFKGAEIVSHRTVPERMKQVAEPELTKQKAYLHFVPDKSKKHFGNGLSSLEAAKKIDFGSYGEWHALARLFMNVERAYNEIRNEPMKTPCDSPVTIDAIYKLEKAKGIEVEF
jgi:glyoxylase-like metal-dependent hydrolase (beta-lactamase superfamily II)